MIADRPGPEGVERLTDLWIEIARSDVFQGGTFERVKNVATLKPSLHETAELRRSARRGPRQGSADRGPPDSLPVCRRLHRDGPPSTGSPTGSLIDAILASSAVPALFPPVEIGGEHFYDGGLVNSVPLTRAVELGADVVYVLQVGRIEAPLRPPERLHEAALIAFEIARRHRYSTTVQNLPEGIDLHLLPSGNPVSFDDSRQRKWRRRLRDPRADQGGLRGVCGLSGRSASMRLPPKWLRRLLIDPAITLAGRPRRGVASVVGDRLPPLSPVTSRENGGSSVSPGFSSSTWRWRRWL